MFFRVVSMVWRDDGLRRRILEDYEHEYRCFISLVGHVFMLNYDWLRWDDKKTMFYLSYDSENFDIIHFINDILSESDFMLKSYFCNI